MAELRRHFRPEFLNRVDDIVLFKSLDFREIKAIIDLLTKDLAGRLKDRHIQLGLSDPCQGIHRKSSLRSRLWRHDR